MSQRYRLHIARPAARALQEVPERVAVAVLEFVTGPLLDEPRRVGRPLAPPPAPRWTARRGAYRVLYRIDDDARVAEVVAIRHRTDAYRS